MLFKYKKFYPPFNLQSHLKMLCGIIALALLLMETESKGMMTDAPPAPPESPIYGAFVVLGHQPTHEGTRELPRVLNHALVLKRRLRGNGWIFSSQTLGQGGLAAQELTTLSYRLLDVFGPVVDQVHFGQTDEEDVFQIGRLQEGNDWAFYTESSSSISRYAIRISCHRELTQCRLFAAGFHGNNFVFLGPGATGFRYEDRKGQAQTDATTTNPTIILFPDQRYGQLSIRGNVLRPDSSVLRLREDEFFENGNLLRDGTEIVMGDAVLRWYTAESWARMQTERDADRSIDTHAPTYRLGCGHLISSEFLTHWMFLLRKLRISPLCPFDGAQLNHENFVRPLPAQTPSPEPAAIKEPILAHDEVISPSVPAGGGEASMDLPKSVP